MLNYRIEENTLKRMCARLFDVRVENCVNNLVNDIQNDDFLYSLLNSELRRMNNRAT